jgi:hypothetical protein
VGQACATGRDRSIANNGGLSRCPYSDDFTCSLDTGFKQFKTCHKGVTLLGAVRAQMQVTSSVGASTSALWRQELVDEPNLSG